MAITFITEDNVGPGTRVGSDGPVDVFVKEGVLVGSTDGVAIRGAIDPDTFLGSSWVVVEGAVVGDTRGVALLGASGMSQRLTIADTGSVYGGAYLSGSSAIVANDGALHDGLLLDLTPSEGNNFSGATVVNRGLISQDFYDFSSYAIDGAFTDPNGKLSLTNYGTIEGSGLGAIRITEGSAAIVNRGTIDGDVRLGYGGTFDNRGGTVDGTIFGGTEFTTFLPGAGEETYNGDAGGADTLDFRSSAGLRVSLMDDSSTGAALGDTYIAVENVMGSRGGADTLIGSAAINRLWGNGGSDLLDGMAGNDALLGGAGTDTLAGGAGLDELTGGADRDLFRFDSPSDGRDVVTDFGSAPGNDDALLIDGSAFGGGLASGGTLAPFRFVARADNVAQDADDRFVFRTTDRTLWFDVDGSGAAGPVLVADLQAGAALTAGDILLF